MAELAQLERSTKARGRGRDDDDWGGPCPAKETHVRQGGVKITKSHRRDTAGARGELFGKSSLAVVAQLERQNDDECDGDGEGDAQMRILTDVATEGYRIKPEVGTFASQQRNLSLLSEWQCDRRSLLQARPAQRCAKRSAPDDDVDEQLAAAARFMNL